MKLTAAGLAMLEQVRVTELPSCTGPEGSAETEVFLGGSETESVPSYKFCKKGYCLAARNAETSFIL